MAVTLYLPAVLAKIVDARSLDASGGTVGEIVADIAQRYPALVLACEKRQASLIPS